MWMIKRERTSRGGARMRGSQEPIHGTQLVEFGVPGLWALWNLFGSVGVEIALFLEKGTSVDSSQEV